MTIKIENAIFKYLKSIEFQKVFICFMLYSVFGWLYEVFLEVVIYQWGFTNRGVLFGPYCPVYGVGATMFVFAFYRYKNASGKNPVLKMLVVFFGCMVIATVIELITSYILEAWTGAWPWQTYTEYAIHFQGRIALSSSIRFGIGGILFLYIMQPAFDRVLAKVGGKRIRVISVVILAVLVADILAKVLVGR